MRLSPENINIEGADGSARTRRQHCRVKRLSTADLPGTRAQFETSGKHAEQERPMKNHKEVGGIERETIKVTPRKCLMGVGPTHSSDEGLEARQAVRRRGAKGWAEQGTWSRDR